jgi:hypothetical protein
MNRNELMTAAQKAILENAQTQQALSINTEVCDPEALESNLAKIISLAGRKGGTVTARVGQDKSISPSRSLQPFQLRQDTLLC